ERTDDARSTACLLGDGVATRATQARARPGGRAARVGVDRPRVARALLAVLGQLWVPGRAQLGLGNGHGTARGRVDDICSLLLGTRSVAHRGLARLPAGLGFLGGS